MTDHIANGESTPLAELYSRIRANQAYHGSQRSAFALGMPYETRAEHDARRERAAEASRRRGSLIEMLGSDPGPLLDALDVGCEAERIAFIKLASAARLAIYDIVSE